MTINFDFFGPRLHVFSWRERCLVSMSVEATRMLTKLRMSDPCFSRCSDAARDCSRRVGIMIFLVVST